MMTAIAISAASPADQPPRSNGHQQRKHSKEYEHDATPCQLPRHD
jgi:hypothetical protein